VFESEVSARWEMLGGLYVPSRLGSWAKALAELALWVGAKSMAELGVLLGLGVSVGLGVQTDLES
jgi:hypothetical protein